jgi:hypothetical protein
LCFATPQLLEHLPLAPALGCGPLGMTQKLVDLRLLLLDVGRRDRSLRVEIRLIDRIGGIIRRW